MTLQVLDFFNSRIDGHAEDGEWSVEKVLQLVIINCRLWRGEGMKLKAKSFWKLAVLPDLRIWMYYI